MSETTLRECKLTHDPTWSNGLYQKTVSGAVWSLEEVASGFYVEDGEVTPNPDKTKIGVVKLPSNYRDDNSPIETVAFDSETAAKQYIAVQLGVSYDA